jgi:3-hydroxyacyl-CoA dehydrogenase/enoyl-CoA hydratase/3-hydroxybutyryl-CoA epimerase
MSTASLEKRTDGVAVLRLDTADSPVNILSRELFDELGPILDEIDGDATIQACVLASGKPGTFIAGANLKQLLEIDSAQEGEGFSRNGHALLNRVASSRKPFVAAIHGPALGGGLEVALACHYILAADDPKTVLGLPEVQLGLLPGGGGTQRLPRRVGLPEALPLILTGRRLRARRAYRLGLVDGLTSPGGLEETAAQAALQLAQGKLRRRKPRRTRINRWLESPLLRPIVFRQARKSTEAKTRGNYPAPLFILDCIRRGYSRGKKAGFDRESVLFGRLAASRKTKCLIRLFESMTDLKKPLPGAEPVEVRRVAVIGGGFMGSGIAQVTIPHLPVTVKDISEDVLTGCAKQVHAGLGRRVKSGAISRFERGRQFAALHLTTRPREMAGSDLIVEAVFEELELKQKVLAEVESVVSPTAVFASNTSALPIGTIAETARHPERVLGLHYFSPVPKMPLLELVVAEKTADWAVATARAFGIRQGKTVIVVKDGPGFYTSRILAPFINEAILLLGEGAGIAEIDRAIKDFGYPVGPLALLDEVGIDVAAHVTRDFGELFADRGLGGSDALVRLNDAGYKGRKNRKGFYRYDDERRKGGRPINEEIYGFFGSPERKAVSHEEIAKRLSLIMVNEAVYCLMEGILSCPRDGDVGAILGLGFPPFRGGPFRYLDGMSLGAAVETLDRLRDAHGPRFAPAPLLQDMAREGRPFYSM